MPSRLTLAMTRTSGSGATIVEAMIARYRHMRSYRDEGSVRYPGLDLPEVRFDTASRPPTVCGRAAIVPSRIDSGSLGRSTSRNSQRAPRLP